MTDVEKCDQPIPEPIPGFANFGIMSLQGVDNARDLGGLPAAPGYRIKKRRLMRSGDLHDATAEDMRQLIDMHDLEYVIDLRTTSEIEREPDPKPLMHGIEYEHLSVVSEGVVGLGGVSVWSITHDLKLAREFTAHPFKKFEDLYSQAVLGELGITAYDTLLHGLLNVDEGGAVLWHCTQGKDRTGIAAILIEYCLGVSMENIRKDYLATNLTVKGWMEHMARTLGRVNLALGFDKAVEAYAYANTCYFDYVMKIFNDIFGGLDAYIEKTLHFSQGEQQQLREMYLERG